MRRPAAALWPPLESTASFMQRCTFPGASLTCHWGQWGSRAGSSLPKARLLLRGCLCSGTAHWPSQDFLRSVLWSEAPPTSCLLSQVDRPALWSKGFPSLPPSCCSHLLPPSQEFPPTNLLHTYFSVGICFSEALNWYMYRAKEFVYGGEGRADVCPLFSKKWKCVSWALLLLLLTRNLRNVRKPFWNFPGEMERKGS